MLIFKLKRKIWWSTSNTNLQIKDNWRWGGVGGEGAGAPSFTPLPISPINCKEIKGRLWGTERMEVWECPGKCLMNYRHHKNICESVSISMGNCKARFPRHFSMATVGAELEAGTLWEEGLPDAGCTASHTHLHGTGSWDGKFLRLLPWRIRLCPGTHLRPPLTRRWQGCL